MELNLVTKIKVGDSIYGRYELYHILEADNGISYVCYDNINRTPYILKTLSRKYLVSPKNQSFFEKEALV